MNMTGFLTQFSILFRWGSCLCCVSSMHAETSESIHTMSCYKESGIYPPVT